MKNIEEAMVVIKILYNTNRFSIVSLLSGTREDFCVSEIAEEIGISQSLASHQLSYLEARGIVSSVRMGQSMCYTLSPLPITKKVIGVIKLLQ
ncbi:MAG: DNA-binding transcriptional ArsR family regulator [Planctomycetota bacterium]|jgi:DNA-binding transcriptional ArsR family regulator